MQRGVMLYECIDLFNEEEQLDEDNMWYCSSCKEHRRAYKKLDIWTLPPILIIHMKRFKFSTRMGSKVDTLVDFPLEGVRRAAGAI